MPESTPPLPDAPTTLNAVTSAGILDDSSIIDNDGLNTLQTAIHQISGGSKELCVATAFFSLDALGMVADNLHDCDQVRILFGDDADRTQRAILLKRLRETSDADISEQRMIDPTLAGLQKAMELFKLGRVKARCYTAKKFHAKAYFVQRIHYPPQLGILGSGNFTRPGLTRNLELNVHLTKEQTKALQEWYELRWNEAAEDDVTDVIGQEILRQITLYDPYVIYQKALMVWGEHYQGSLGPDEDLALTDVLDPHQALGFSRAKEILLREHGVMICDGVGLGKSFIALALMEHFCRKKANVLLIAPKSIMNSSWNQYLEKYLERYRQPFGSIFEKFMTDLGFEADEEPTTEALERKQEELQKLVERADVIVVDESHNFRTPSAQRYENLYKIVRSVSPGGEDRKKVILLTATPVNTRYADLAAQLALVTHEDGRLAGYPMEKIRFATKDLDRKAMEQRGTQPSPQMTLGFGHDGSASMELLDKVLGASVIQRKRTTCIELAKAKGKELLFPIREKPTVMEYELSDSFKKVVELAQKRFAPTAAFLKQLKREYKRAEEQGIEFKPPKMPAKFEGIKFAAFLPEQYRRVGPQAGRTYQTEVFLASMVFTNTLKQLESSPAAFQGILQSLGTGLIARLEYVYKEAARADVEPHANWVRMPIQSVDLTDAEGDLESGELADLNGTELDEWLEKAIAARHLHKKLADFNADDFDQERWRNDIIKDLDHLREIHKETIEARQFPDYKLEEVEKILKKRLNQGQRVIVFTQSVRTSFYIEKEIAKRFPTHSVARIDSNVKQETRDDILYAFCPKYNPAPRLINRERVDILICTDVLSEGVNMQEAECILNYDIHWNPVRLIQRIGRVDRRLDPQKNPVPHKFSIYNCLPPSEINDIIQLVDTVEDRTTMINRTLGIDSAFFKASDPEGTLREFNAMVDGEPTLTDRINALYVEALAKPDPALQRVVEQLPPGAFGVWEGAPCNGVFALFEMQGTKRLTQADRDTYGSIIGLPVLALAADGRIRLDGPEILSLLQSTIKGEHSGNPSGTDYLKHSLKSIKDKINQSFREINLVASIQPRLLCWLELRKSS